MGPCTARAPLILYGAPVTDLFVKCHLKLHIDITLHYITRTCSMPGFSGLYSGLVSTCSGTSLQPTFGISSQFCSTASASCSFEHLRLDPVHTKVATDVTKNYFSNGVIDIWNCLPSCIVSASSLNSFKRNINSVDFSKFLTVEV